MNNDHDGGMRRLHPDPQDDVSVADAYGAPLGGPSDRPWVALCMVASIDGSTVFDGASGGLSNPTDIAVLLQLRSLAQVILVGAGTANTEGYGPPSGGQRVGVVTRAGSVNFDSDLFTSGVGFVVTAADSTFAVPDGVEVMRAGTNAVDLGEAIRQLPRVVADCHVVQVEGGPTLNGALLRADLLDEMNVTTSATTVGGNGPRLTTGAAIHVRRFEVAQIAIDEMSFVYTRWLRMGG